MRGWRLLGIRDLIDHEQRADGATNLRVVALTILVKIVAALVLLGGLCELLRAARLCLLIRVLMFIARRGFQV